MELQVNEAHVITGRGLVFAISLSKNRLSAEDLKTGGFVSVEGKEYVISSVEAARQMGRVADTVGLVVREK